MPIWDETHFNPDDEPDIPEPPGPEPGWVWDDDAGEWIWDDAYGDAPVSEHDEPESVGGDLPEWYDQSITDEWLDMWDEYGDDLEYEEYEIGVYYGEEA